MSRIGDYVLELQSQGVLLPENPHNDAEPDFLDYSGGNTKTIPYNRMRELFNYVDGHLIRKTTKSSRAKAGDIAGSFHKATGYIHICVDGTKYSAHRIIYGLHFGVIPNGLEIDHINGNRADNRIENLRLVTRRENMLNQNNAKGYYWNKDREKWFAQIKVDGVQKFLGYFEKEEDARQAYLDAKKEFHTIQDHAKDYMKTEQYAKEHNDHEQMIIDNFLDSVKGHSL